MLAALAVSAVGLAACGSSATTPVAAPHSPGVKAGPGPPANPEPPAPPPPVAGSTVAVAVGAGNGAAPFDTARTLSAPAGTTVEAWARISGARFETWSPAGDLLVSVPSAGRIDRLHPGSQPGDPPTITTVVTNLSSPQGMAFDTLGAMTVLYVAEDKQVDRYPWTGTTVGSPTVVANLPDPARLGSYSHPLKDVVVGPDHRIYVDVASSANVAPGDRTATPPRAVIESFRPDGSGGIVVAQGVRNGDGLAFAPDGTLWTAVNERDNLVGPDGRVDQAYVNDHPPDDLASVGGGRDLGWPYCVPVLGRGADPLANMALQPDVQTNPDGRALDCAALRPIERGIAAHSAPLGLAFLEGSRLPTVWRAGAVVAAHGSFNRVPPRPGEVLWLPWEGSTLGPVQTMLGGFVSAGGERWGRPVDAVPGPDGALYVSDDTAGAIYRVSLPAGP